MAKESQQKLFDEVYETKERLGEGSFGVVFRCVRKDNGQEYAVKAVTRQYEEHLELMEDEVSICRELDHINIIRMADFFRQDNPTRFHLVFELASGGELFDDIYNREHYTELDASHCMEQILQGVNYLHRNNILHNDLKTENILLTNSENDVIVKIADFGMALRIEEDDDGFMSTLAMQYLSYLTAPEIGLKEEFCRFPVDMWACGAILYVMLYGTQPFFGEPAQILHQMITEDLIFHCPTSPTISDDAEALIRELLRKDPCSRLTATEALEHWFIKGRKTETSRFYRPTSLGQATNNEDSLPSTSSGRYRSKPYKRPTPPSSDEDKPIDAHSLICSVCSVVDSATQWEERILRIVGRIFPERNKAPLTARPPVFSLVTFPEGSETKTIKLIVPKDAKIGNEIYTMISRNIRQGLMRKYAGVEPMGSAPMIRITRKRSVSNVSCPGQLERSEKDDVSPGKKPGRK